MTIQDIYTRFQAVIHDGLTHPHYERVTMLADKYKRMVTGEGLEYDLLQYTPREDPEAFEQRKRITKQIVSASIHGVSTVKQKVFRANYRRVLEYDDDQNGIRSEEFEAILNRFYGAASLDNFFSTRWSELDDIDPNAFIVIEFGDFDNIRERAQPYPFEVSAHEAVDFAYQNNILQYLVCRQEIPNTGKSQFDNTWYKFTLYGPNEAVIFTQVDPKAYPLAIWGNSDKVPYFEELNGQNFFISKRRVFMVENPTPYNLDMVPAFRAGYNRDQATKGHTFVSFYHSGVPFLDKMIKTTSELDLTMCLSAFPFRAEYAPPCDAAGCFGGNMHDGAKCQVCKGTGHKSVTSAQEKLVLTMPRDNQDLVDLEKLVVFKSPETGILAFQNDYIKQLQAAFKEAVFNSQVFSKQEVSDTATGKNLDYQAVYDTLYPTAQAYADKWAFSVLTISRITGMDAGLTARLIFSKDFKLKGMAELLADLETAKRSGAGPAVLRAIQSDIQRLIFADNPAEFERWKIQESFNPFSGKTPEEIAMSLTDSNVPTRYKVLYNMLGVIFDELVQDVPNFYQLERRRQAALIDGKILQYQGADESASFLSSMNDVDNLGKIPLAMQQLALARERAKDSGDIELYNSIGRKMDQLLEKIT